ncbi:MAG: hypothetical protein AB9897_04295 [Anaerolineaceae bacterium]
MKTKVFAVSLLLVLMLTVTACGAVSSLKTTGSTGDAFMQALKDQDNEASWNLLTQAVKDEVGDQAAWADFTAPRAFESWKFTSNNITNNEAQLDGTATINGETYNVTLVLDQSGDSWLISGVNFTQ